MLNTECYDWTSVRACIIAIVEKHWDIIDKVKLRDLGAWHDEDNMGIYFLNKNGHVCSHINWYHVEDDLGYDWSSDKLVNMINDVLKDYTDARVE